MKKASVIIPIYNNAAALKRCLETFKQQVVSKDNFEIIVTDDASIDMDTGMLAEYSKSGFIKFTRNLQRSGPGFSRNRALEIAGGEIIIFCDGDTAACADYIGEHLKTHSEYPAKEYVVLGRVADPPEIKMTPLMRLGNVTQTWNYIDRMKIDLDDWTLFRTTNISLKRSFLGDEFFNERIFGDIGFEDTELGARLSKRGMKIIYNRNALAYHYHFRKPVEYIAKVFCYGKTFRKWMDACEERQRNELNRKFNCILDTANLFSLYNLKEMIRRVLVNDFTAPLIICLAQRFEKTNEKLSAFFYGKIFKYIFLKGYIRRG